MSKGKNFADFRAIHDRSVTAPKLMRECLAAMKKEGGDENWLYEGDFIKRAGINQSDIGRFREQFKDHVVDVRVPNRGTKRVWVADVKAAAKFRDAINN